MKTILSSLLFTLFLGSLFAQSDATFKVVGDASNTVQVANDGKLDISKIKVKNITNEPIYLEWKTVTNTFPSEWDCSMCQHGACQIGIPSGSIFKKLNADQQGFIAIHVLPKKVSGKGLVQFKLYDKNNPSYFKILSFEVEVL